MLLILLSNSINFIWHNGNELDDIGEWASQPAPVARRVPGLRKHVLRRSIYDRDAHQALLARIPGLHLQGI